MGITHFLIGVVCAAAFCTDLASAQSTPLGEATEGNILSCSPAPCVLPPTQATQGPHQNFDAPIAADPTNLRNLTVGSNDYNCGANGFESVGFYLSRDGGSAWDQVCMTSLSYNGLQYDPANSPVLAYDAKGVVYIGGSYFDNNDFTQLEAFEKSSDGVTWSSAMPDVVRKNYAPSYCWMAADDRPSSPYINSVYVSCVMVGPSNNNSQNQVVVAHSRDGGASWQQVNVAPVQQAPDQDFYTALTVGRDGAVYLTWMYCNVGPQACDNNKGYMVFSKSADGGDTWSQPKLVATATLEFPVPNTSINVPDTPAIAVDNSAGTHTGNLYVVMYNWTGTFMQVQVVRSTDGGTTWSKPVPVAPGETHDQFLPWISVSPKGLIGVSWLDRRNDPNNIDYQAFGAVSADGGLSFQPNVELTTAFSDPTLGGGSSIGDYAGNTWDGANYFVAAWMDNSQTTFMQDFVGGIRLR